MTNGRGETGRKGVEEEVDKPIQISIQANTGGPRAVTLMNKGSCVGPNRHRSHGSEPPSTTMNYKSLLFSSLPSIRPSQPTGLSLGGKFRITGKGMF